MILLKIIFLEILLFKMSPREHTPESLCLLYFYRIYSKCSTFLKLIFSFSKWEFYIHYNVFLVRYFYILHGYISQQRKLDMYSLNI